MEEYIYKIVIYLGIAGLFLLLFSFLTGLRIIKTKPKYKIHRWLGIVGFSAAAIHGFYMLYNYLFS